MTSQKRKIILASASPRRKWLMEAAGFIIEQIESNVDEIIPEDANPIEICQLLAKDKAEDVYRKHAGENDVVIAADTVVSYENVILGKPASRSEAFEMIALLSGNYHQVSTGVCIICAGETDVFVDNTIVQFHPLDKSEIESYIELFKPFDKAGGYGIQDWMGICKVRSLQGNYTNVMGMPMDLVYHHLQKLF